MSDNQIRDIFANAEDWSPANDAGDGSDSTTDGTDSDTQWGKRYDCLRQFDPKHNSADASDRK